MRTLVVYNPTASRAQQLNSMLDQLSSELDFQWSPLPSDPDAPQIVRQAIAQGMTRLVVAGGDGTIHEVVNGMAPDFPMELAIMPCGTGNDLARSLGLPLDDPESALRLALSQPSRPIDLIRVNIDDKISYCINAANGGLGGCIARDVHADTKKQWGHVAYWVTAISKFGQLPEYQVVLELDEQVHEFDSTGVAIANGRYIGGGFPIAPHACLNDGLIDVSVAPRLPPLELMAAGLSFVMGQPEQETRIKRFQAKSVHLRSDPPMPISIDGEPAISFDALFEVMASALDLVTGPYALGCRDRSVPKSRGRN